MISEKLLSVVILSCCVFCPALAMLSIKGFRPLIIAFDRASTSTPLLSLMALISSFMSAFEELAAGAALGLIALAIVSAIVFASEVSFSETGAAAKGKPSGSSIFRLSRTALISS